LVSRLAPALLAADVLSANSLPAFAAVGVINSLPYRLGLNSLSVSIDVSLGESVLCGRMPLGTIKQPGLNSELRWAI
jgi:hypothetical protein